MFVQPDFSWIVVEEETYDPPLPPPSHSYSLETPVYDVSAAAEVDREEYYQPHLQFHVSQSTSSRVQDALSREVPALLSSYVPTLPSPLSDICDALSRPLSPLFDAPALSPSFDVPRPIPTLVATAKRTFKCRSKKCPLPASPFRTPLPAAVSKTKTPRRHPKELAAVPRRHPKEFAAVPKRHPKELSAVPRRHPKELSAIPRRHPKELSAVPRKRSKELAAMPRKPFCPKELAAVPISKTRTPVPTQNLLPALKISMVFETSKKKAIENMGLFTERDIVLLHPDPEEYEILESYL